MGLCLILKVKNLKPFLNMRKKNKLGFLALEYTGHGKSSGKFTMEILVNGLEKSKPYN